MLLLFFSALGLSYSLSCGESTKSAALIEEGAGLRTEAPVSVSEAKALKDAGDAGGAASSGASTMSEKQQEVFTEMTSRGGSACTEGTQRAGSTGSGGQSAGSEAAEAEKSGAESVLSAEAGSALEQETLCVYVCGAVAHPDVYHLRQGARAADALQRAGGFTEEAAREAINLARPLADGEMLKFPTEEELLSGAWTAAEAESFGQTMQAEERREEGITRVNLNSADRAQLCTLPGIGQQKAERIIAYREQHGPFRSTEEIKNIPGIKDKAYEKLRDRISVQ